MARWNICVPNVVGVLKRTANAAEDFDPQLKTYGTSLETAAKSSGSGIVAKALVDFATHHNAGIEAMVNRTVNSISSTGEATKAYIRGDTQMALDAQRHATAVSTDKRNVGLLR